MFGACGRRVSRPTGSRWPPRDPVPGDVTEIAKLTRRYSDTAEAIRARPVSCASTMAGAMRALDTVQPDAEDLLTKAKEAETDRQDAERKAALAADPESSIHGDLGRLNGDAQHAEQRLSALRTQLTDLVDRWRAAGDAAARAIEDVSKHDGLKDSGREDFLGTLKTVATWAGGLAALFFAIALLCAFIPFLEPLVALFTALAFVLSLASLICDGILYANDRSALSDLIWDIVGDLSFGTGPDLRQVGPQNA